MKAYADLEIGLHRRDAGSYAVELRFNQPESDADVRLVQSSSALVRFDIDQLRALEFDAAAYGQLLGKNLFADPAVWADFTQAYRNAQSLDGPLRLRLFIGPSASELHNLHWETLRDPQDGSSLLVGEQILFSRYLSSLDWRPVRLRPKGDLRALVVIASPNGLASYKLGDRPLAPLDVEGELMRAKASLRGTPLTVLASDGSAPGKATLNNMLTHLRDDYDILYLICHGALIKGESWLWLEDEAGKVARVAGGELVTRLRELQQRPRLVVLASCQSAGSGAESHSSDEGALAALGPSLAEVCIPAVLAMQGNVTMRTAALFMPAFFRELREHGQIDRAMAVARGVVRERPDSWVPVLFMRLKSGRIWYVPGFADARPGFEKWPALFDSISERSCTPILGPGLVESLLGSRRAIARNWAETYNFPMAPHDREDLPQVAQYVAVKQNKTLLRNQLAGALRQEILRRYADDLPGELRSEDVPLSQLIQAVADQRRAADPAEPHNVLAKLPFPIYITTNPDNLLADALIAVGKTPQVEICPWNKYAGELHSIYDDEPNYRPTLERPLVYHLFGHIREPRSLVLTQDDYFDYLIGVTSNKDLIPSRLRRALADSALLFLGFQMDDWNFRVLFRSIMGRGGGNRLGEYTHVAAQIDPEEGRILEPAGARRYLEGYFQRADISIYWGSIENFMKELLSRWTAYSDKGSSVTLTRGLS